MAIDEHFKMASTMMWCHKCKDYTLHYKKLGAGNPWLCDKCGEEK